MNTERLAVMLQEQSSDAPKREIKVNLLSEAGKLWIQPQGYGDKTSANGCGYPIGLEIWEERLRLIVFDDIHCEDPKIIDLERARESCRRESDDSPEPCGNDQTITPRLDPSITFSLNERELATLLAALRFHQDENLQGRSTIADEVINEIASDKGQWLPLSFNEINALCERINTDSSLTVTVSLPPKESGQPPLYRVVYVIDVNADDARAAAKATHTIMSDPDSWPPVLETIDSQGHLLRIDLCQTEKDNPLTNQEGNDHESGPNPL